MILRSLTLTNFKNIPQAALAFSPKVNCFIGNNGMGKSNLLDAIHYLSFCKSFSGVADSMLIRAGEDFTIVRGEYLRKDKPETVVAGISRGRRKSFKRGDKEYDRLSSHIGAFPLVMVSPSDMDIINGAGEVRRRFMDMIISQGNPTYLDALIRYDKLLHQRNNMLREGIADANLYVAVETLMSQAAGFITNARSQWVAQLSEIFAEYYPAIAGSDEAVSLTYDSQMLNAGEDLQSLLDANHQRDAILHHTSVGPHRDDIAMTLDGMPLRRTASQGQAKTFTIALRLAQYDFLRNIIDIEPLLLLDDIFDKLDAVRVERIMQIVARDSFGQIFITDTNRKHIDEILAHLGGNYSVWNVENGVFLPAQTLPL